MEHVVIFLDESGGIVRWGEGARRLFLHSPEEIAGKHVSYLFNDEDCDARVPERELLTAAREG